MASPFRPLPSDLRPLECNRDYKKWMQAQTDAWVTAVGQYAQEQTGKPITPLSSWRYDKEQLDRPWPHLLNSFLPIAFPTMADTLGTHLSYYWTLWQSEWATDLIMNTPAELTATMASLVRHAWITGNSANVLRYLDRPLTAVGKPDGRCTHEVMSRVLDFHDGRRVRHWVDHNSVKVYNEQNVLRIETTINMPDMFKVYRRAQGQPHTARKKLRPLRKGVADIPLRAQVSQEVNDRLMDELSTFTNC